MNILIIILIRTSAVLTLLMAALSVMTLVTGLNQAEGAVQEISVIAIALAMVIIPYCATKALKELLT
jgi:multisubunit Na+/H+ antiporter MnhB subunit